MARGWFITLEGGEAGGKSTQVARLAERWRAVGRTVITLREPGGTPLGEALRHLLKHDPVGQGMAPETELLLMNASRAELVRRVIRPALAAGQVVLCDRFADSTVAYQGYGRGLDLDRVRSVVATAVGDTVPDLTLWLQVPPEEAAQRLMRRGSDPAGADRFEAERRPFFARVEAGYAALAAAEPGRVIPVDGKGSPDEVAARIEAVLRRRLGPTEFPIQPAPALA